MSVSQTIREELSKARNELLDLGLRNPLLNHRTTKARGLDITEELPAEVYRILVEEGRRMSFLPVPKEDIEPIIDGEDAFLDGAYEGDLAQLLSQPEEDLGDDRAARQRDTRLQTPYTSNKLQSRLLSTLYAARTFIEERGVNVLYLAIGMLEWYEDKSSELKRRAPLILIPVSLTRTDVRARFRLIYTGEDVGGNISLQAKLKTSFGLSIPVPDTEKEVEVEDYFRRVEKVVSDRSGWRVDHEAIHLGFFHFGKLLMYLDLDVDAWPDRAKPVNHPVIRALLGEGFPPVTDRLDENVHLDGHIHPDEIHHIADADGSQTLALLDVKHGHHLVIQGPPGTGKSQTIMNVIAQAVGEGKTVLFVAEKMAALEVVKRRLDEAQIGDACLELHSHKTNKKKMVAELGRTLRLGKPLVQKRKPTIEMLVSTRDELNEYADAVNKPVGESTITPYDAYGFLLVQRERWEGLAPPEGLTAALEGWAPAEYARRRALMENLQSLVLSMGTPTRHPFWGSLRLSFLPSEQAEIESTGRTAASAVSELRGKAGELSRILGLPADSPVDVSILIRAARRALTAPNLRGVVVNSGEWHARRTDVSDLVKAGENFSSVRGRFNDVLIPEAWMEDVLETRQDLSAHGRKWYRVLISDWRQAKNMLAGLMAHALPKSCEDRLAIVEGILESQRLRIEIVRFASLGSGLFGLQWEGPDSDWNVLRRITDWMADLHQDIDRGEIPRGLIAFLAGGPDLDTLEPFIVSADSALRKLATTTRAVFDLVELEESKRFGEQRTYSDCSFDTLAGLFAGWVKDAPKLQEMVTFNHQSGAVAKDGLLEFVNLAQEWEHAGTHLIDAFEYNWYNSILNSAFSERQSLASFSGPSHTNTLRRFVDHDERSLVQNRAYVALQHWENMPNQAAAPDAAGQLKILLLEISKKRRHKSIRRLMKEAGRAIQAVKPVLMMSPISIASYIPPGSVEFDLVIFDEASQIKPVDAFGALMRGKQAVVVGDSKQLPPTRFFDSVLGDDYDEELAAAGDVESVLELFRSSRAPERMLLWHYRSRHESLIAVSNQEFYENRLIVFPSPDSEKAQVGLIYHYLEDARYDRGGRSTNRKEARVVAESVMQHARTSPNLSLMVATFSQAQQKEVWDQVELLRKHSPATERFFGVDGPEPFTVKNLENVQGDERDVVFISVGYGRDQNGVISMNFGPLNQDGGERRLNVLITRARRRCEVFSNLRAGDIDLNRTRARGVVVFKKYLQFAETGELEMSVPTGQMPDSMFEIAVASAIRNLGYRVENQVGIAGYSIDLGIVDPEHPGRYILGIECDGATYHSARTARDRDRIRQAVLEDLGWRIHRVWSTDWFRDPEREVKNVVAAIEEASSESVDVELFPESEYQGRPILIREDEPELDTYPPRSIPYERVTLTGYQEPLHEVPTGELATDIALIVGIESPVHSDEVARRIREASGVRRLGRKIREAIDHAVQLSIRRGEVVQRGEFLYCKASSFSSVTVRDRRDLPDASRKIDFVSPEEIQIAIASTINSSFGIGAEEVPLGVCRLLGFGQTSEAMRSAVQDSLDAMKKAGTIIEYEGQLQLSDANERLT